MQAPVQDPRPARVETHKGGLEGSLPDLFEVLDVLVPEELDRRRGRVGVTIGVVVVVVIVVVVIVVGIVAATTCVPSDKQPHLAEVIQLASAQPGEVDKERSAFGLCLLLRVCRLRLQQRWKRWWLRKRESSGHVVVVADAAAASAVVVVHDIS